MGEYTGGDAGLDDGGEVAIALADGIASWQRVAGGKVASGGVVWQNCGGERKGR